LENITKFLQHTSFKYSKL